MTRSLRISALFLAAALSAAGIPIARVRARKAYALHEVRQEILSALVPA